jgi:serine/threonine protein phosphatase PrpC
MNEITANNNTSKSYNAMKTLKSDNLSKNKQNSRNNVISNTDSENINHNIGGKASTGIPHSFAQKQNVATASSNNRLSDSKRDTWFNSVRLSHDRRNTQNDKISDGHKHSSIRWKKESGQRNTYISKNNMFDHQSGVYKVRAASSSLNRKGEDGFMFRQPNHRTAAPTPKGVNLVEDNAATEISSGVKRDLESGSNAKRTSLHRIKKVNKVPIEKHEISKKNVHKLSSRGKQHSVKTRLVYKKESMKNIASNSIKNDFSNAGNTNSTNMSKMENKENDFMQSNNNMKMNRTSSGRDNQKSIKSMSGMRKLYTLKANGSSRKLESQSYRDLNYKHRNNETVKNGKVLQSTTNIYNTTINVGKKRHFKNKTSTSETPKLRSHNEAMFSNIKSKIKSKEFQEDKENKENRPSNYTSNCDTRLLKKPPNPNTLKQVMPSNAPKKPNFTVVPDHRRMENSMDRKAEEAKQQEQEEYMKRNRVQQQILTHLQTGSLPQDSIITPIMSNDGHIRQYIINDPIADPDEIDSEAGIISGDKITNTTVDRSKWSTRKNGIVKAYAANTNKGIIRNYNEDRVSIILNILKPNSRKGEEWPKWSFFGVFDGHGGAACADFLRDNLHQFVIKEPSFPTKPQEALLKGFEAAEKTFVQNAQENGDVVEKSGSWAIVILIVGEEWYVANVGDSRAVLSFDKGRKAKALSKDHKPSTQMERKRIQEAGGQIYQTATVASSGDPHNLPEIIIGPIRVFPGRLSVSRTFGDTEAKITSKGGNPDVVVWTPDICSFKLDSRHDYVILGWDGIFDKMTDREWVDWVWDCVYQNPNQDVHQVLGLGAEWIMKNSLSRRSLDNVTVVIIAFAGFRDAVQSLREQKFGFDNVSQMLRPEKRNSSFQDKSKSQRSASQNQMLGVSRDLLTNKTLV